MPPKRTFKQTTKEQKLAMVMFLENPANQNIIDGKAVTGIPISGKPVTKNAGFAQMALFVNKHCKDSQWNAKIASETHRLTENSGWGLTEQDHTNGINTIDAKLEDLDNKDYNDNEDYNDYEILDDQNKGKTENGINDIQNKKTLLSFIMDEINLDSDSEK
ncbi:19207_t:CDS:2, partial [Racocetra fulgida]